MNPATHPMYHHHQRSQPALQHVLFFERIDFEVCRESQVYQQGQHFHGVVQNMARLQACWPINYAANTHCGSTAGYSVVVSPAVLHFAGLLLGSSIDVAVC